MTSQTIGVLHPGEMGVTVGASARAEDPACCGPPRGGARRPGSAPPRPGSRTPRRSRPLCAASGVILSVCPPHSALDLAREVAAQRLLRPLRGRRTPSRPGPRGRSAGSSRARARPSWTAASSGLPPARAAPRACISRVTRPRASPRLFAQGPLEAIALDGGPGAASALKMAYAAYTKGTSALLVSIRAMAIQAGVDQALLDEWALSQEDARRPLRARGRRDRAEGVAIHGRDGGDRGDVR